MITSRIVTRKPRMSKSNNDFKMCSRFSGIALKEGLYPGSLQAASQKTKPKKDSKSADWSKDAQKMKASKSTLGYSGLLTPLQTVIWIPKRWKQCPEESVTCPKKPAELGSSQLEQIDPCYVQPKVIIIGAGIAGISAAYKLSQSGYKNFRIYEATERLGGRIHSCWLGDVVGELGVNWLNNSTLANPLYSLAAQEELLKDPVPWRTKPPLSKTPHLASDGRAIETNITVPAVGLFRRLKYKAFSLFSIDSGGKTQESLLDFLKQRFDEELKAVPEDWKSEVARVIWGLLNHFKTKYGTDPRQLSTEMYGSNVPLPGESLRIPLGMSGILAPLLKGIDPQCINYCTPVQGITWHGGNPRATVRLAGGDVQTADYVLVTVPLGFLKCNWESFFTPCLPDSKREAIGKLGFGTINNIILKYLKPFWLPGEGLLRFAWSEKELTVKDSWVKGLSSVEDLPGTTNVLTLRLGDAEALMSETCTDDTLAEGITNALRQFSGDSSLPYPTGILRSRWGSEPFFRGSRSYLSVGSTVQDQCDLGAPIPGPDSRAAPIVLFAGEATVPGYSGSLLGAHMSGLREADRILSLTKKYRGLPPEDPCR